MGKLEKEVAKKVHRARMRNIILSSLAIAGIMSIAILAPNALRVLQYITPQKKYKKNPQYIFNDSLRRLSERGFIELVGEGDKRFARLTNHGHAALTRLEKHNFNIKKPKRWDKKWRVVIFDIKEHKRGTRNTLRQTLLNIGFQKLQNSVWVYPYDCEDLITILKTDFRVGKEILYLIVDKIENDYWLRKNFSLLP